jgi:hypothetical protein
MMGGGQSEGGGLSAVVELQGTSFGSRRGIEAEGKAVGRQPFREEVKRMQHDLMSRRRTTMRRW